jgi:hypothetical protein
VQEKRENARVSESAAEDRMNTINNRIKFPLQDIPPEIIAAAKAMIRLRDEPMSPVDFETKVLEFFIEFDKYRTREVEYLKKQWQDCINLLPGPYVTSRTE